MKLNETAGLVTSNAMMTCEHLDAQLAKEGYTLGYYPIPNSQVTLRDCLQERLPNLFAERYGEVENICMSLKFVAKDGTVLQTTRAPRASMGPDFKRMLIGSGMAMGKVTEATFRIFPLPERVIWGVSFWKNSEEARVCLSHLLKKGAVPSYLGIFEPKDLPEVLARHKETGLLVKWEGLRDIVRAYGRFGIVTVEKLGGKDISRQARTWIALLEKFIRSPEGIKANLWKRN